jgi:hypothetical protein
MTAFTDTLGFNKGSAALPSEKLYKSFAVSVTLDMAKIVAARLAAGATALAVSDTLQVIPIPAKSRVENVGMEITTVSTNGTATYALGDSSAAAGYLAAQALTPVGLYGGVPVLSAGAFVPSLSGGKVYAAADNIIVTLGTALPTASVVRVFAEITDLS